MRVWLNRYAMRRARARKAHRGMTAKELSDETDRLGLRISPTVIAKLDSEDHRGSVLNVDELLVLSAALNMPPALLLFPGYPDGEVEILPGRKVSSRQAAEWFGGHARLPGDDGPRNPGVELDEAVREYAAAEDGLIAVAALAEAKELPESAVKRMRQQRLDRMLDMGQKITELQRQLEGEN
jgi:hypothetical protein